MDPEWYLVGSVLAVGVVLLVSGAWQALTARRNLSWIQRFPPLTPESLQAGRVELIGALAALAPPTAPLLAPRSQRPCVAWRVVIEAKIRDRWVELARRSSAPPLVVEGGGQQVQLVGEALWVRTQPGTEVAEVLDAESEALEALARQIDAPIDPTKIPGGLVQVREVCWRAGEPVIAIGSARRVGEGWELSEEGGGLVASDQSDAAVLSGERRRGLLWGLAAVVGLGMISYGGLQGYTLSQRDETAPRTDR